MTAYAAADGRLHEATAAVAAAWPAQTGPAGGEVAEPAAGEQLLARAEVDVDAANEIAESAAAEGLLVRAGVEANAGNETAAGVAADVAESVCCPVERLEVEVQLPATHHVAAVGIAPPTLELPQVGQPQRDGIARAEAIATACDSAAATLEGWAAALRASRRLGRPRGTGVGGEPIGASLNGLTVAVFVAITVVIAAHTCPP